MNANQQYDPSGGQKRTTGIAMVILLHILIVWGLASGLARKAVEIVKKPIEMKVLEEIKLPPPPPPPPPPPKELKPLDTPPPVQAPPPPFVPPPEVQPQVQPTAPVIQATQVEAPRAPVEIAPPPPPAPPAPAPQAPAPKVERIEVGVACPGYKETLQKALTGVYDRVGIDATVHVQFKLRDGKVTEVATKGPREYQRPVENAVRRFNCSATTAEQASVTFDVAFMEQ